MNLRTYPRRTSFCEKLVAHNALSESGFKEWVFCPGMLFRSREKWWEGGGRRNDFHQGVDFSLYRDRSGTVHALNETTKLPALYSGKVANIIDDFVGKSIVMTHEVYKNSGEQLVSVCGHTEPLSWIGCGESVKEGEMIATIADFKLKKAKMGSHVHISIAWVPATLPHELLNWDTLSDFHMVTLLNPLLVMDCNYSVLEEMVQKGV